MSSGSDAGAAGVPNKRIRVAPETNAVLADAFRRAVDEAGGTLTDGDDATALIWADPQRPDLFPEIADASPHLDWVQLPYAGIEPFAPYFFEGPVWTCGKGVYATPVAELALALMLAGRRHLYQFIGASTWGDRVGENLLGTTVTILGGGGIAEEFIRLAAPFDCTINVVRRSASPVPGAARTLTIDEVDDVLGSSDILLIAWPLTDETYRWVNRDVFERLPDHAWIINVGRGGHVDHDDLYHALVEGTIGGAALDVTDPEPLPDDSPLWAIPQCIITPHVGNTAEMGVPLISARVKDNTERYLAGRPLVGQVDLAAGY